MHRNYRPLFEPLFTKEELNQSKNEQKALNITLIVLFICSVSLTLI